MLKKMFKSCLAIAMICAMAAPVYAEVEKKVGVRGRAVAELVQTSVKDGASSLNMWSEGRIGLSMSAKEGDWSIGGVTELRTKEAAVTDNLYNWVHVENDAVKLSMGRQWWGMVYLSAYTGYSNKADRYCYGCGMAGLGSDGAGLPNFGVRDARFIATIKSVGLQVMAQLNAETTYNETAFGVLYPAKFGPLKLTAQYVSYSTAIDAKNTKHVKKGSAEDGGSTGELAVGLAYNLSEAMYFDFHFESNTYQSGVAGSKAAAATTMGLGANIGLGNGMGVGAYFDNSSRDDGTPKKKVGTAITASFLKSFNGQQLWVAYNSTGLKDDDIALDSNTSNIALGGRVNF